MCWGLRARLIKRGLGASWFGGSRRARDVGRRRLARSGFCWLVHGTDAVRIDGDTREVNIVGRMGTNKGAVDA